MFKKKKYTELKIVGVVVGAVAAVGGLILGIKKLKKRGNTECVCEEGCCEDEVGCESECCCGDEEITVIEYLDEEDSITDEEVSEECK